MKHSKKIFIPLLLFLISFYLRLSLISKGPYHADCLHLALTAEQILEQRKLLYLQSPGHPLTALSGAVFVFFFRALGVKNLVFSVNFMSVFVSSASIVLLYFLGKKVFDEKTGFLSALILLFNPIFLATSVYGNSHCLSVFFMLLTFLFIARGKETRTYFSYCFAGIFLGFMGGARLQEALFVFIPALLWIFLDQGEEQEAISFFRKAKNASVFLIFSLGVMICFYFPPLLMIGKTTISKNTLFQNVSFVYKGIHPQSFIKNFKQLLSSLTFLGLCLSFWGGLDLLLKNKKLFFVFFFWSVPFLIITGGLAFTTPRFFIISLVPLVLLQGRLLARIKAETNVTKTIYFLLFFLLISLSLASVYPLLKFRNQKALLPQFYVWIGQKTEKNAIIIERDHSLFIRYYSQRKTMSLPNDGYSLHPKELLRFKRELDDFLKRGIPVYATGTGIRGFNPSFKYEEFMKKNYQLNFIGHEFIESWYRGALEFRVGLIPLYKVELKNKSGENNGL